MHFCAKSAFLCPQPSLLRRMDEPNKISNRPIFLRDDSWERFPDWTRSSRILAKDCGLPPLLDASDLDWIDWAKRRLGSFSWPSFTQSPLLGQFDAEQQSKTEAAGQQSGVAEVQTGPDSWRINLHVSHFSPEEITVVTKEGYLLISGTLYSTRKSAYFIDLLGCI